MNWLYYLAEANLYLGVFYLAYCLFLNKETYYQLNRAYLVFSCIVSFILPLIQIGRLKPVEQIVQYAAPATVVNEHLTLQHGILYAYLVGVIIFIALLILKLYQLKKLTSAKSLIINDRYKLIYLTDSTTAFSFFNYLFIGTQVSEIELITKHELVHIRQKHSVDIILLELLKIISWFNPFIYLLQNSLKAVHEYIADEQTATSGSDTLTYSAFLVNNAYGLSGSSITHSFFNYNLLKKRIIMLNQKRSGSLARLKYLIALPLCAGLLCESTMGFSKTYGWIDVAPQRLQQATALAIAPPDTVKKPAMVIGKIIPSHGKLVPPPPPPQPPKKKVKVTDVKLLPPPPPPEPKAPKSVADKDHKLPPPAPKPRVASDVRVKTTDVKLGSITAPGLKAKSDVRVKVTYVKLTPPPKSKTDMVKFPPPVVTPAKRKTEIVKFPPPVVTSPKPKAGHVKFLPPVVTPDNPKKN